MNTPVLIARRAGGNSVLVVYALLVGAALVFDLFGDRAFGALMLAVLPISTIAVVCLHVGPWLSKKSRGTALKHWLIGVVLVLAITLLFSSLGAEQAKTGELIFTYAALTMALPLSLVLPFVMSWSEPLMSSSLTLRVVFAWAICVAAGGVEWWVFGWLRDSVGRRRARQP